MKGFPRSLLAQMQCPYCGSALEVAVDFGAGEHLQDAVLRFAPWQTPSEPIAADLRPIPPAGTDLFGDRSIFPGPIWGQIYFPGSCYSRRCVAEIWRRENRSVPIWLRGK